MSTISESGSHLSSLISHLLRCPMIQTLDRPTLVLNRNWQPVSVAPVARALSLVVAERARIVDPVDFRQYTWADWAQRVPETDELFVQAVTFRVRVPE